MRTMSKQRTMRQRFKTNCCSHTTPDGRSKMGQREILRKKFEGGTITREELRSYANILHGTKKESPTTVCVTIWGKPQTVSYEEYKRVYEPQGFTCTTI